MFLRSFAALALVAASAAPVLAGGMTMSQMDTHHGAHVGTHHGMHPTYHVAVPVRQESLRDGPMTPDVGRQKIVRAGDVKTTAELSRSGLRADDRILVSSFGTEMASHRGSHWRANDYR